MGYIYCITNLVNNKKYVGKTTQTLEVRFKKHCLDSKRESKEKRPLYNAMNKYGIDKFEITLLEESDDNLLEQREVYWIEKLNTYGSNGYNATKGGDGKLLYNHNRIIELYKEGYNIPKIAQIIGCAESTIRILIKVSDVEIHEGHSKKIVQYDLEGNVLYQFWGSVEAAHYLVDNGLASSKTKIKTISRAIVGCCQGVRKTAYKFKWKYI